MKVHIKDIRPEGMDLTESMDPGYVGLTEKDHLYFVSPIAVNAHVERVDNTLLARVDVAGRYHSFCYRTFVDVERDWSDSFDLDFDIDRDTEDVELDDDIRQEIIMRVPMRVLADGVDEEAPEEPQKENNEETRTYRPFEKLKDIE